MPEHRLCPHEFQDRLTVAGGVNSYDEPIFRIAWGQTETFRGGGAWARDGFVGYRDMLLGSNDPCWMILMWEPADVYGSPERYYHENRDEATGLCTLGEYPYHGRYRLIHKLMHRSMVDGELYTEHMELNSMMIDVLMPMVRVWQSLSAERKVAALKYEIDLKEHELLERAADAKMQCKPAFGYASRAVAKKVEQMEKNWRALMAAAAGMQRGFAQR